MKNIVEELISKIEETLSADAARKTNNTSNKYTFKSQNHYIKIKRSYQRYISSKKPIETNNYSIEVYNIDKQFKRAIQIDQITKNFEETNSNVIFYNNEKDNVTILFDQIGNIIITPYKENDQKITLQHILNFFKNMISVLSNEEKNIKLIEKLNKREI